MIDILRNRRSIRKYVPESLDKKLIDFIAEALLRSPSSRNINPWEFIQVDDSAILKKLSRAKAHGSNFLENAPLGIVVCGDETKSDVWVEDCSIASIIAQLQSHSLGLGSCWIQIRNRHHNSEISAEKYIQNLLKIPSHLRVESIIAIGIPDEKKQPLSKEKLDYGKLHKNLY